MGRSKMPMRDILALKSKLPSDTRSIRFSHSELGESKNQGRISISERDPDKQQKGNISKCTAVWPKVYRVEWGARRVCEAKNTQTSQLPSWRQRTRQRCPQNKLLQMLRPNKDEEYLGQAWRSIPKTWCTWSTVALQYIWWDSLLWIIMRRRLFDSASKNSSYSDLQMTLWSQTRKQSSTSRSLVLVHGHIWWKILRQCCRWESFGRFYNELVLSYLWPTGETPRCQKVRTVIECNIENFVPLVAVIKQKASGTIHWNFWQLREILIEKRGVEDTTLDLSQTFTEGLEERDLSQLRQLGVAPSMTLSKNHLLMRNFPRLSPMRERSSCTWNQEQERYHRFPTKRKPKCVHSLSERLQLWSLWEDKNDTSQVQHKTSEARGRDCPFCKIRRFGHGRS